MISNPVIHERPAEISQTKNGRIVVNLPTTYNINASAYISNHRFSCTEQLNILSDKFPSFRLFAQRDSRPFYFVSINANMKMTKCRIR